jgi:lysophospholipase L1-like esterase
MHTGTRRPGARATMLLAVVAMAACLVALTASAASAAYPNSMAATGDSITRAFNTCSFPFIDCPANSWATGTSTTVNSFYLRILAVNPGISGHLSNDAVSGAQMADLPSQVANAVRQRVEFVTIAMGANDVCTGSEETMTSVASFESSLRGAMATLARELPATKISIGSVPNIYWLWSLLHTNRSAVSTWNSLGICQSMLRNPTSTSAEDEARRLRVQQRNVEFNTVIANVCATYATCEFDNNTGYNFRFEANEVSTRDYFHPAVRGQQSIARVEWPLVRF